MTTTNDNIVKDGETVRVNMLLMDSVQRSVVDQRPAAYEEMCDRASNAWRNPPTTDRPAPASATPSTDRAAAFDELIARQRNAWRTQ